MTDESAPLFEYSSRPVLEPQPGCAWASTMVLNPAIIQDPRRDRLHMLFRACGSGAAAGFATHPPPYPIYLGYAWSDDRGASWQADFSRPALAPALKSRAGDLLVHAADGRRIVNHANGCVEDPRLQFFEEQCYLTVACRMFPPGPYWENDEPMQCAPEWARLGDHSFGRAANENVTVSVLFRVDIEKLNERRYEEAFALVTHLTNPEYGDNRDVFLFPRRLRIDRAPMVVSVHRPHDAAGFVPGSGAKPRSILLSAAPSFELLASDSAKHHLLAEPVFDWEGDRVGGSWPPIELEPGTWLLPYHGKQDSRVGYTQSFMILEEQGTGFPKIIHRCPERLMFAQQDWELHGKFPTPCLFTCGGVLIADRLVMSYGAADTKAGIASVNWRELTNYVRRFDPDGRKTS